MQIIRTQKGVCKDFEINNLDGYHYLYVQGDNIIVN